MTLDHTDTRHTTPVLVLSRLISVISICFQARQTLPHSGNFTYARFSALPVGDSMRSSPLPSSSSSLAPTHSPPPAPPASTNPLLQLHLHYQPPPPPSSLPSSSVLSCGLAPVSSGVVLGDVTVLLESQSLKMGGCASILLLGRSRITLDPLIETHQAHPTPTNIHRHLSPVNLGPGDQERQGDAGVWVAKTRQLCRNECRLHVVISPLVVIIVVIGVCDYREHCGGVIVAVWLSYQRRQQLTGGSASL
ncbi:hypothetical protein Pmani_038640 [Petrolisthes manimaculis]|uniref:Uncharacterized protein n=1 Tax=Petrolisthes manimaculis TaxID=1843537 RepID=A0AAE1NFW2_9EUCA|nr:hypothetical protein Pmani_038640 [Petrolisthes manimaculis]